MLHSTLVRSVAWGFAALIALLPAAACGQEGQAAEQRTVTIAVDYRDGAKREWSIPWKAEMTVLDALQAVAKHPRGVKVEHRGSEDTAFVTKIDGVENEGAGRNWLFQVNGKKANRSCGILKLEAGDSVLWQFAKFR